MAIIHVNSYNYGNYYITKGYVLKLYKILVLIINPKQSQSWHAH